MSDDEAPSLYPGEPPAVRLMNTIWASRGELHDSLATTRLARAWAHAAEFPGASRVTAEQLARLRRLRDGLRRVAAHVTDDDRAPAVQWDLALDQAVEAVDAHLVSRRPGLIRTDDDTLAVTWRHEATGFDEVLADLALEGAELVGEGSAELHVCHGPGCVLYYVKNHPRRGWCSAGCGNRARVARHYRKQVRG